MITPEDAVRMAEMFERGEYGCRGLNCQDCPVYGGGACDNTKNQEVAVKLRAWAAEAKQFLEELKEAE